jgi:hypothetical protein
MSIERELLEECKTAILANIQKWQYKDEVALYNVLQKIEAELAKPEPEPVLLTDEEWEKIINYKDTPYYLKNNSLIGYKAIERAVLKAQRSQPAREPLSDDEIEDIRLRMCNVIVCPHNEYADYIEFARAIEKAIEKAHGIGADHGST